MITVDRSVQGESMKHGTVKKPVSLNWTQEHMHALNIYMHTCIHVCAHHTHVCTHTHTHIHTHTHTHLHTHTHMHAHIHACMHARTHTHTHTHTHTRTHACTHARMHARTHTHTHTNTHTHTHTYHSENHLTRVFTDPFHLWRIQPVGQTQFQMSVRYKNKAGASSCSINQWRYLSIQCLGYSVSNSPPKISSWNDTFQECAKLAIYCLE